jgi:hypothetical protein
MRSPRTNSGRRLNQEWNVGAAHSLCHKHGEWYHLLEQFPGALFDPNGYVLFETREELGRHSNITLGEHLHVSGGISQMPNYVRMA